MLDYITEVYVIQGVHNKSFISLYKRTKKTKNCLISRHRRSKEVA